MPARTCAYACSPNLIAMGKTVRQAVRATFQLAMAAALAFGACLFATILLFTIIATLAVIGAVMLPETVLLLHRMAGAKRRQATAWTGQQIPEAYLPLPGPLREG